jgi:hypothetical protein
MFWIWAVLIAWLILLCAVLFVNYCIHPHEKCYAQMHADGHAAMGCCGGLTGGDVSTGYLQYECLNCRYFVGINDFVKGGQ